MTGIYIKGRFSFKFEAVSRKNKPYKTKIEPTSLIQKDQVVVD